jgi:hypothetical protein
MAHVEHRGRATFIAVVTIAVALLVASLSAASARRASEGRRINHNSNSQLDPVASLVTV